MTKNGKEIKEIRYAYGTEITSGISDIIMNIKKSMEIEKAKAKKEYIKVWNDRDELQDELSAWIELYQDGWTRKPTTMKHIGKLNAKILRLTKKLKKIRFNWFEGNEHVF